MINSIIKFYKDKEVRAVWDDENSKWWFSLLDILAVLREVDDYDKNRNYWKFLSSKLKRENNPLVNEIKLLKLTAPDNKSRLSNVIDYNGIKALTKSFPSSTSGEFLEWLTYSVETIDDKSKTKAYALFDSSLLDSLEIGTVKGLQQIHAYIFGGLYDFAGQIRTLNIAKGNFKFAPVEFLNETLKEIENMPEKTFEQIVQKYVEMNIAHPFMEGNGRSMRIWLDLILKKNLKLVINWSNIDKKDYLTAMKESVYDHKAILNLLESSKTEKINDRELYMKGIDTSYYYEEID